DTYKYKKPPLFLIFKGLMPASNEWWVKNLPGTWRKMHAVAQGYQLNNEMIYVKYLRPYATKFHNGYATRMRGEYSNTFRAWHKSAPVWNLYWAALWNLTHGVDMLNYRNTELLNKDHVPVFEFLSKYAGYKDPSDCVGVWCALRDGLDCMDTVRFPEEQFGELKSGQNKQRYINIANAFAAYGCLQDDPDNSLHRGLSTITKGKALNDVGYNIWTDNYYMYLYQHNPNGTSRGCWRVGPKNQRFGRYARSVHDAAYFNIDDRFFSNKPLNAEYEVQVRVVYFDKDYSEWALQYDAVGNPRKTAYVVNTNNTRQWKEKVVTIKDGYFGNRCPYGTDLILVSTDDGSNIFHMIELTRKTGFRR
ncbi:hypothetical protein KAS50_02475, partial [bacterium]|nr:hypothetical protein [bacterium]